MFKESVDDLLLITTNATITKAGKLVMGRGAAKEASTLYPLLPLHLGKAINEYAEAYGKQQALKYGLLILPSSLYDKPRVGAFQVKHNYYNKAEVSLISIGFIKLIAFMTGNPELKVSLNYPGIGNGGLREKEVRKVIPDLNNLTIWFKKDTYIPCVKKGEK